MMLLNFLQNSQIYTCVRAYFYRIPLSNLFDRILFMNVDYKLKQKSNFTWRCIQNALKHLKCSVLQELLLSAVQGPTNCVQTIQFCMPNILLLSFVYFEPTFFIGWKLFYFLSKHEHLNNVWLFHCFWNLDQI